MLLLKKVVLSLSLLVGCILAVACQSSEPIQIGFVGGLSGRVADLGVAGRNGAQLVIEKWNAAGGVDGRLIELVIRDDEQNPEIAQQVVEELLKQKIELIIGPMTSSIAMAIVPQVNSSSVILLSPTVTTTDLVGIDDNFLRVMSTTTEYGSKSARYQFQKLGIRTVAVLYDIGNRSYSESWLNEFRRAFEELGGKILLTRSFQSGDETLFRPLAEELLAVKADSVLIISNAVDSAMTCQQLRKLAPRQQIALSEWASTERFTELAGGTAEGVVVAQFMDRNDPSARYQEFLRAYRERFQQEPGFAGLAGYDAALIALEAYAGRNQGETLKHYIIAKKSFQGAQQLLNIDRFGDADRGTFVTIVRDKQYITVE